MLGAQAVPAQEFGSCRAFAVVVSSGENKKIRKGPPKQSQTVKQQCVELIPYSGNVERLVVESQECDAAASQFTLAELGVVHCLPAAR